MVRTEAYRPEPASESPAASRNGPGGKRPAAVQAAGRNCGCPLCAPAPVGARARFSAHCDGLDVPEPVSYAGLALTHALVFAPFSS